MQEMWLSGYIGTRFGIWKLILVQTLIQTVSFFHSPPSLSHASICECAHACVHARVPASVRTCVCVCVHACVHVGECVCMYVHVCVCACMHIHACILCEWVHVCVFCFLVLLEARRFQLSLTFSVSLDCQLVGVQSSVNLQKDLIDH